ncbi:hypothetical protein, partial [Oceanimonas marisflavi]|uniref:hypothetical protein n=1 Tax=Oceanimonas marisflavi TaxID=2059724 RepID=UPI0018E4E3CD
MWMLTMRANGFAVSLLLAVQPFAASAAAPATWQPPAGTPELPRGPDGQVMAPPNLKGPEQVSETVSRASGEHWRRLQNVAVPTLTVFPAKGSPTGTAVMVV